MTVTSPAVATGIKVQRALAWSGPVMLVIWVAAFGLLCRYIPPPSPSRSPEQVVAHIAQNVNAFRLGMVLTLFASALLVPFSAVISTQMRRIEGAHGPLAQTQVISGGLLSVEFIVPIMVWLTAAYRIHEQDPRVIQMLNDMGFLMFVAVISTVIVQIVAFGIAILIDHRPEPVFPRWAGYFMLWVGAVLSPAGLCVFVKSGPLAWNGILAMWIPLATYASWILATFWLLRRALNTADA